MTDFRALCAELVDYWENDCPVTLAEVMERARAALAEPEPEGPTDEELMKLAAEALGYECIPVDGHETEGSALEAYGSELLAFAHAALARWGRPAPQPEPEGLGDEELWAIWNEHDGPIPTILRAAIAADRARWGGDQELEGADNA